METRASGVRLPAQPKHRIVPDYSGRRSTTGEGFTAGNPIAKHSFQFDCVLTLKRVGSSYFCWFVEEAFKNALFFKKKKNKYKKETYRKGSRGSWRRSVASCQKKTTISTESRGTREDEQAVRKATVRRDGGESLSS